ncbi:MAG: cyclase family protein [Gammaproteobacteria bacterium]|nr:cyclase family protein [Gammaproteobacteria bacterium]
MDTLSCAPALAAMASLRIDLASPVSLAAPLRFDGRDPRHFDAPAPRRWPLALPGFSGEVRRGASCNCSTLELTPHCNGTHTECVAHLVDEPLDACEIAPRGPLLALLLSIPPVSAAGSGEDSDPAPQPGDRLLTRVALRAAWPETLPFAPRALVLRSSAPLAVASTTALAAPYLSRQLAAELVARGIEHLVVELPSIDRGQDQGRLCAHRIFFGLPPGSTRLAEAQRGGCTITELAAIPAELPDGPCALQLALPRIAGDAVPSQPLLYRLVAA